jgi:cellulose synthase/poly-beta-1,6-N-acetylglucosamine synthase-like glycosyltransferase
VPDPVCWTEAPEDFKTLKNQRIRWHMGLSESLGTHMDLLFHPKGGAVSWLAFPFQVFFEWLSPLIEMTGIILTLVLFALGFISFKASAIFLGAARALGILMSINAILLEEITFHVYPKFRHLLTLFGMVLIEGFGYRQINSYWRLVGLYRYLTKKKSVWGEMKRKGADKG